MAQTNAYLLGLLSGLSTKTDATNLAVSNNNTATVNSLALKAPLASPVLTGTPTTPTGSAGVSSLQIANGAWVLAEIASAISSSIRAAGDWDASANLYPSATSGTGAGGAIRQGDQFTISVAGTLGSQAVDMGSVVYAKVATPGQTSTNWVILEHNLLQATEGLRGTILLASVSDASTESSTEDTKAVTLKKLWLAFAQYASIARTITGKWTFSNGIDLNSQKITNVAAGVLATDALNFSQLTGRFRGAWTASTYYAQNDSVLQGGLRYFALANFTSAASFLASNWTLDTTSGPATASVNGLVKIGAGVTVTTDGSISVIQALNSLAVSSSIAPPTVDTTVAALALKANLASPALTGTPTTPTGTAGLSSQQIANGAWVLNEITTAGASAIRAAGDWDASGNLYPSATSGTGVSGAIRQGDQFTISVAGVLGTMSVEPGSVVYAKIAVPGQTSTNWVILQHNLQQATEALRGTLMLASVADASTESNTEDTKAVTLKKLWLALAQYVSQARTIAGKWTFSAGIDVNTQKITNLAPGVLATDALNFSQLTGRLHGAWTASTYYAQYDEVTYGGVLYYATVAFTSGTSFVLANWTLITSSIPDPTSNSRKTIKSDGTSGTYQYQVTNDVVGGAGIYTTLALASAAGESIVRKKGQIVTVTDDPTTANNASYVVKSDLSLSIISTSQFTMGQFGAYTATTAGAQTISTLGSGAVGVFDITVLETNNAERPLSPSEYSVSSGVLTILASALVAVGDVITGYYFGTSGIGQTVVQPLGGIFRGTYAAGLTYQQYDTVVNPSGALVAATTYISPSPATYSSATWFDASANKANVDAYAALTYASSIALDFKSYTIQSIAATGSLSFATSVNVTAGKSKELFITNTSASAIPLSIPTGWSVFPGPMPTSLAAAGIIRLKFTCLGALDANVAVTYSGGTVGSSASSPLGTN